MGLSDGMEWERQHGSPVPRTDVARQQGRETSTIKAGTIISFAGGCWDDKWVSSPYRAKVDFDRAEVTDAFFVKFRSAPPEDGDDYVYGYFEFLEYLIAGGFIEEVESKIQWHVGDYDAHEFNPY